MSDISTHKLTKVGNAHVFEEQLLYRGCWSEMVEFSYEEYQLMETLKEDDIPEDLKEKSINLMMKMMECTL